MSIFSNKSLPSQEVSLKKIEDTLLDLNVSTFIKEYDGDNLASIYFNITDKDQGEVPVRLPLSLNKIKEAEMAEMIALSELAKFIEITCSLVRSGQTTLTEVFLPFVYDKKTNKTFYETIESKDLKLIEK